MRSTWTWPPIALAAALIGWPQPPPAAAQTSPAPGASLVGTPVAPPPVSPAAEAPGSSVSPAIERFMRQAGRSLALPPAVPVRRPVDRPTSPPIPPVESPAPGTPAPAPASTGRNPAYAPNPLATGLALKPAPTTPSDLRFPINLATALRLSDARPIIVAAAQASVWVAEAELTRAKVLWIPSILFGADYVRHDGGGPDFNKGIMTAPSVNFFYAGPSLYQNVNLTDAYFEPLVARRLLNARHWEVQTSKNDALMQTADAYFRVHQYRGTYAGSLYCVERGRDLVDRITQLSKDLVPRVEVDRARNMLADLEQRASLARQEWRVSSADLTQVLRLDPRAVVEPLEHDHAQVTLIDPGRSLDDLMPVALTNRPELASYRSMVEAAELRVRRERTRPFTPVVQLNGFQSAGMLIQGGIFGLGPNSSLNQFTGRSDVSVQLIWQLENFGIGNLARIKRQRGEESRTIVALRQTQDMVVADVKRAQARVQSAAARVLQADRALRTAIITFNGHLEGLEQTRRLGNVLILTFRPQEAVYSLEQLNVSFDQYFSTVSDYNRAQFELFHALGYPAREISSLRSPGDLVPVDTNRPGYLPPVGNGPPPATR